VTPFSNPTISSSSKSDPDKDSEDELPQGKKSSNTYQNNIFLDWKHTFFNFLHPFSSEVVAPRVDSIIPHQAPSLTKSTYGRALSPSRVVYCNLYVPTKTSVKVKAHCIKQQTRTRASRYASFLSFCHCTPWFPTKHVHAHVRQLSKIASIASS